MLEYKDIVVILVTLVASFAGAWGAFLLENERHKREVVDRNVGAANRAIYTLFNRWNILEQYRNEVLEPYRSKPDLWLNLAATRLSQPESRPFNQASFSSCSSHRRRRSMPGLCSKSNGSPLRQP